MSRTPKAVLTAAFPPAHRVAGITLPPMSILTYLALEAVQSPLVREKATVTIADMATAVALMQAPVADMSAIVSRYLMGGADKDAASVEIRAMAMQIAAQIPIWQLNDLTVQLREQMRVGFSTAVAMRDPEAGSPLAPRTTARKTSPAGAGRSS
jgi:hypothetical protein